MIKALSQKLKKKKKGFTLIELIIVIAIIAIIAAFAIPNYMKVQKNAKIDADINLGRTIAQAVEVMTVDGTIGTEKEDEAEGTEKTVELKVNEANSEEDAKKIEGYIKEGTLKLKTKGAGDTLTITISKDGKVESIVNNDDDDSLLYGKGAPSGIFKK